MKAILLSACLMISILSINANTPVNGDPNESLSSQMSEIISKSAIWNDFEGDTNLLVSFTINSDGEVVILSTDSPKMDLAIKNSLNYKKLKVSKKVYNKIFHLPITVQKQV